MRIFFSVFRKVHTAGSSLSSLESGCRIPGAARLFVFGAQRRRRGIASTCTTHHTHHPSDGPQKQISSVAVNNKTARYSPERMTGTGGAQHRPDSPFTTSLRPFQCHVRLRVRDQALLSSLRERAAPRMVLFLCDSFGPEDLD